MTETRSTTLVESHDEENAITTNQNPDTRPLLSAGTIFVRVYTTSGMMFLAFTATLGAAGTVIMVTQLDSKSVEHLAAAGLITVMTNVVVILPQAFLMPLGMLASQHEGALRNVDLAATDANDTLEKIRTKIADLYKAGLLTTTAAGLISFPAMYYSKTILTHWFGQDEYVAELVQQYMRISALSLIPYIFRIPSESMLFGMGNPGLATLIGFPSFLAGTGFAVAFAYPLGMGVPGVALGYFLEALITGVGFTAAIKLHPTFKDIPFFSLPTRGIGKQLKELLQVGSSAFMQMGGDFVSAFAISTLAGRFGKVQLGAQSFATQLFTLAVLPSFASAQVVSQEVSRLIGEKDYINARRFARFGLLASLSEVLIPSVIFAVKPEWWALIMAHSINPAEMRLAKQIIPFATMQVVADTAVINLVTTSRSTGDYLGPTLLRIVFLALGVAVGYILSTLTPLKFDGLVGSPVMALIAAFTFLLPMWLNNTSAANMRQRAEAPPKLQEANGETVFYRIAKKCCPTLYGPKNNFTETSTINGKTGADYGSRGSGSDDELPKFLPQKKPKS